MHVQIESVEGKKELPRYVAPTGRFGRSYCPIHGQQTPTITRAVTTEVILFHLLPVFCHVPFPSSAAKTDPGRLGVGMEGRWDGGTFLFAFDEVLCFVLQTGLGSWQIKRKPLIQAGSCCWRDIDGDVADWISPKTTVKGRVKPMHD